jgi:hypothetical protein
LGPRNIKGVLHSILEFVALPLNYFVELGFFLVAGVAYLRNLRGRRPETGPLSLIVLATVSIFVSTFLRSRVEANDLNWRGILPAQFVLLLWAAEMLRIRPISGRMFRFLWMPLLVIGVAGTTYELALLRFRGMLADAGVAQPYFTPDRQLGSRTLAFRQAFEQLDRLLPADAVVQSNPRVHNFDVVFFGLYARHQTAANHSRCGTAWGGSFEECEAVLPVLTEIFEGHLLPSQVASLCRRFSIDALVVRDLDEVWSDPSSWAQQQTPAIANQHVRIYLGVSQLSDR